MSEHVGMCNYVMHKTEVGHGYATWQELNVYLSDKVFFVGHHLSLADFLLYRSLHRIFVSSVTAWFVTLISLFILNSMNYTMSQKGIPDIFDCNLKTNYQVLIIFGTNIPDTTCHQMTIQFPTSPNVCFCTTWGKHNQRNITFLCTRTSIAIARISYCNSVRPSVLLSATSRYRSKTNEMETLGFHHMIA